MILDFSWRDMTEHWMYSCVGKKVLIQRLNSFPLCVFFFFIFLSSFFVPSFHQCSCNNWRDGANVFYPYVWMNEWIWLQSLGPFQGQSVYVCVVWCVCSYMCILVFVVVHFKTSIPLCPCPVLGGMDASLNFLSIFFFSLPMCVCVLMCN